MEFGTMRLNEYILIVPFPALLHIWPDEYRRAIEYQLHNFTQLRFGLNNHSTYAKATADRRDLINIVNSEWSIVNKELPAWLTLTIHHSPLTIYPLPSNILVIPPNKPPPSSLR